MSSIAELVEAYGITRLCHLTPYRNLLQIARGGGLKSVAELADDERAAFDPQDLERLDGHPDHICCTVQYPNVWYLRSRRRDMTPLQRLFPDWVCVLIEPSYLSREDTLVCHRNAAAGRGAFLRSGPKGFKAMFADPVQGSRGPIFRDRKPVSCPTDDQAEVLISKAVPLTCANRIVVADEEQAKRIYVGLDVIGAPVQTLRWIIAPQFFQTTLSRTLREGGLPSETPWDMPTSEQVS